MTLDEEEKQLKFADPNHQKDPSFSTGKSLGTEGVIIHRGAFIGKRMYNRPDKTNVHPKRKKMPSIDE